MQIVRNWPGNTTVSWNFEKSCCTIYLSEREPDPDSALEKAAEMAKEVGWVE